MYVIDLPLTTHELAPREALTIRHELLELEVGLEPGQLPFGQDENGVFWGVEVLEVAFDETATRYRLKIGNPIDPAVVDLLCRERLARGRFGVGDVRVALKSMGELSRLTA